jgi:hypothetical protein
MGRREPVLRLDLVVRVGERQQKSQFVPYHRVALPPLHGTPGRRHLYTRIGLG